MHFADFQYLIMEGEVIEIANKVIAGITAEDVLKLCVVKGNVFLIAFCIGNGQLYLVQICSDGAGLSIIGQCEMVLLRGIKIGREIHIDLERVVLISESEHRTAV